jgi:hypothetical protein
LEAVIGISPVAGNERAIMDKILENPSTRSFINEWIAKQGIPIASAKTASTTSIARAYCIPGYLRSWRNRVNPNFALLGDDDEDGEAGFDAAEAEKVNAAFQAEQAKLNANKSSWDNAVRRATTDAPPAGEVKVDAEWLRKLYSQIEVTTGKLIDLKLRDHRPEVSPAERKVIQDMAEAGAKDAAEKMAEEVVKRLMPPREIVVRNETTGVTNSVGLQHRKFPLLLRAAQARNASGHHLNIWLTGMAGSGKTTAAMSVAKALGLEFEAESSLDADFKILGYRSPDGVYQETAFFRRFTQGGVILLDEIDNFAPSALLAANAATANDFCQFPHGLFKRHPDCIVIACANTWGMGATNQYVGRSKLDAASLDRFQPKIDWTLDEDLERAVAERQGGARALMWHDIVLRARHAARRQGLQILITPRATYAGIGLLQQGFKVSEVVEMTLTAGLSGEQVKALNLQTSFDEEELLEESVA